MEFSRDSELSTDFFKAVRPEIKFISTKLSLTEMQSVLLSIFIDKCEDSRIRASEIASFLGIGTIRMLKYIDEIEDLVNKRYLKGSNRREDRTYRVPPQVLKAMRLNEPFEYKIDPVKNTQDFFDRFNTLAKEKEKDEIEYEALQPAGQLYSPFSATVEMGHGVSQTCQTEILHGLDSHFNSFRQLQALILVELTQNEFYLGAGGIVITYAEAQTRIILCAEFRGYIFKAVMAGVGARPSKTNLSERERQIIDKHEQIFERHLLLIHPEPNGYSA